MKQLLRGIFAALMISCLAQAQQPAAGSDQSSAHKYFTDVVLVNQKREVPVGQILS